MSTILSSSKFANGFLPKPFKSRHGRVGLPVPFRTRYRPFSGCRCQASEGQRFVSAAGDRHRFIEGISTFPTLNGGLSDIADARKKLEKSGCTENEEEPVWDDWAQLFDEMDRAAQRVNDLDDQLSQAVSAEDYRQAADIKRELDGVVAKDTVAQVLQDLNTALVNEDYGTAAELRDAAGAGLLGWWCGRGEDDPFGHLLHVTSDFGRYCGKAYTPKDLAEVKGWTEENFFRGIVEKARSLDDVGSPVMEIFVQKREDGSYRKQVCALLHAEGGVHDHEIEINVVKGASITDYQIEERGLEDDGRYMKIQVTYPDEHPNASNVSINGEMTLEDGPRFVTEDSDEEELSSSDSTLLMDDDTAALLLTSSRDAAGEVVMQRVAATLRMVNKDKFEFEILDSDDIAADDSDEASASSSGSEEHSSWELRGGPNGNRGPTTDMPTRSSNKSWLDDAPDLQNTLLKFAKEAANFHTKHKSPNKDDPAAQSSGRDEVLREMEKDTVGGTAQASRTSLSAALADTEIVPFNGSITYDRLPTCTAKTDPFSGMFLGAFGPHGPELLQLKRVQWKDGEDAIFGVKVTGDPNVPAGSLSFRAVVGRRHRLDPHEEYPPELGVVARYKGEGRVAHSGFKNAKWVEGELLQFSPSSPVTRGAELGFVWQVPNEKKFLILLNRISLD